MFVWSAQQPTCECWRKKTLFMHVVEKFFDDERRYIVVPTHKNQSRFPCTRQCRLRMTESKKWKGAEKDSDVYRRSKRAAWRYIIGGFNRRLPKYVWIWKNGNDRHRFLWLSPLERVDLEKTGGKGEDQRDGVWQCDGVWQWINFCRWNFATRAHRFISPRNYADLMEWLRIP